jgi:type IV pilus assembly protein PilW
MPPSFLPCLPCARLAQRQRGVSLIELMVGIVLGLLVVMAAIGTLMVSRAASATVGDITQLQQQGSYALRVMGLQFRQAGSIDIESRELTGLYLFKNDYTGYEGNGLSITGADGAGAAPDTVAVSNQPASALPTQRRNCLGDAADAAASMDSTFTVSGAELSCKTKSEKTVQNQALIRNVADFQARYRVLEGTATRSYTATEVSAADLWGSVKAVEICLDLQGDSLDDAGASGSYVNCQGISTARAGRLHVVLRNVFDLRPRGT